MAQKKFVFPFDRFKPNRLVHFDVATDDRVWYFPTDDIRQVSDLLANPYLWAHKTQSCDGWSPTIAPYFVVSFQQSGSPQLGGSTPHSKYIIHGINGTGCVSVTIDAATEQLQDCLMTLDVEDPSDAGDFTIQSENGLCFWCLNLGTDPTIRSFVLSNAIINPGYLMRWMNGLEQFAPGIPPIPLAERYRFHLPDDPSDMTVVYEGCLDGMEEKYTCNVGDASAVLDDDRNVVVHRVVVKTYPRAGKGNTLNLPLKRAYEEKMPVSACRRLEA